METSYKSDQVDKLLHLLGRSDDETSTPEVDLDEIFRMLWRRKFVVLGTVAAALVATVIYLSVTIPRFTAEALIQIEPAKDNIVGIEEVASALSGDTVAVVGEVQVIGSRAIADRVISAHADLLVPELLGESAGRYDPSDGVARVWSKLSTSGANGSVPSGHSGTSHPKDSSAYVSGLGAAEFRSVVVDEFLERLSVSQVERSNVVSVRFESARAQTAAAIVDAVADMYIEAQLASKFESTQLASEFLNERLAELEAKVQESERKIEDFRADIGLVEGVQAPLLTEQVSRLNAELAAAQAQATETEARLREARSLKGADIETIAVVLRSSAIQNLRDDAAQLSQRRADLSTQFGSEHPVWVSINAEQADLQAKLDEEVARVVDSLSSEERVAKARVGALAQRVQELQGLAADASRAGVHLRALERDADADRRLFELFLARAKEMTIQDGIQRPDARVVSYADVPTEPSHPKKPLVLAVALVFSAVLGLTFAFIVERLDLTTFRTPDDLERFLGLPILSQVPLVRTRTGRRGSPPDFVLAQPNSSYAEALRGIHTAMFLHRSQNAPRVILVTSSLPGEGKTSTTAAFARTLSDVGKRVIVIDCDLRRPRLHDALKSPNSVGLAEYLMSASPEVAVHKDKGSDLHFVTAGRTGARASQLLQSDRMVNLVGALQANYDVILFDSPPVLAVVDSRILAQLADATIFLVKWGKTRRKAVKSAIKLLREAEQPFVGCVMGFVDARRMSGYGYGDAGAYYGNKQLSDYYTG